MKSGGDGANTTKALTTEYYIHNGYFSGNSSFFNELKRGGKHLLMSYVYFLASLNYVLKLLD